MIQNVTVKKLFGLYDYNISFLPEPAVKIITGPNGYGKTSLLIAINHLFRRDFWFFHFLEFETFKIELSEQTIMINKSRIVNHNDSDELKLDVSDEGIYEESIVLFDSKGKQIEQFIMKDEYIQYLYSCAKSKASREAFNTRIDDLIAKYYYIDEDNYIQQHCKNISLALQENETVYLPAQRLYVRELDPSYPFRYPHYSYEIDYVNEQISKLYQSAQNSFAAESQRIDATFISRLIQKSDEYSEKEIGSKLEELKSTIEGYKELNLITNMEILDYSSENKKSYDEFKKVLSLYIDDMNKKMKRFEDLYRKISLYKQVVTSKVLSEKTIEFCDTGLKIINKNGRKLTDLHKLSSGEQNLLILYYNLIFKSKRNTILLIDEPENSIHVAWLSTMLNDYIKMAETTRCQIVLATHSPTFIDGKWDLCTDLYRQYKGKDTNE